MKFVTNDIYYKRLSKFSLPMLVTFFCILSTFSIAEIIVFYFRYTPNIIEPIRDFISPDLFAFVHSGINKIILYLGMWLFLVLAMNALFIYVLWNVKKLLSALSTTTNQT